MTETLAQAIETLKRSQSMLKPVLETFDARLAEFGADPRSAFWRDADWQRRRYDILSRLFAEDDRHGGISITDFGSGYGAFFDYLKDRPVMDASHYTGIDLSAAMIAEAKTNITDPRAIFQRHLIATERTDYMFVCGTYNMLLDADRNAWTDYVKASLAQLWSMTDKALGFNMLRADAPEKYQSLYYADPKEFQDFCRTTLSADITYTDDSPLPDWTIFIRRSL
ncbi:MAG: class I SAM-dependent methyltransferase [Rhodospirillales bacterium]|nr:class I SAM-dependent methyltransferase [Alphaproteobacteria bacterium]MBL6947249.1 class I SAM-dependent methyltransferase [Rhodospirillales bacterium]